VITDDRLKCLGDILDGSVDNFGAAGARYLVSLGEPFEGIGGAYCVGADDECSVAAVVSDGGTQVIA